jgi:uncharacterized cupin superfamily protein
MPSILDPEMHMSQDASPKPLLTADDIAEADEVHIKHPWNPKSDIYIRRLSDIAGLKRAVLQIARVPPGKESFLPHWHEHDEEFLYILSGRGRAEIGDEVFEVGPGDFMGFPPGGPAHHLMNPYDEDLVYLMGGERSGLDVGHFPRAGRKIIFGPSGIYAADDADIQQMSLGQWLAKD